MPNLFSSSASRRCAFSQTSSSTIRSSGRSRTTGLPVGVCFFLPWELRIVVVAPQAHRPTYFGLASIRRTCWWCQPAVLARCPLGTPSRVSSLAIQAIDRPSANHAKVSRTRAASPSQTRSPFLGLGPRRLSCSSQSASR